ncbi:MAG: hypothetical protein M5U12_25615 [Verrucomicrobia bacterium]|nr:hypothetical protein [Verrucomicrobiota bacterium]
MMLTITYQNGAMTGHGVVDVSIKICWCFTLTVRRPFTLPFARPGGSGGGARRVRSTAGNAGAPPTDGYGDEPEPEHLEKAVDLYFQNLLLN